MECQRLDTVSLVTTVDDQKNDVLLLKDQVEVVTEATMQLISLGCDSSMPRKRSRPGRRSAYWWTEEIAALRSMSSKSEKIGQGENIES